MNSNAPLPIDQLLAHRDWVRRVARAMARDQSDADDLEQGLWLDALRHPPRTGRSLRGWIFTALRRDVANARLSEASRARREAATTRREAIPSAGELVARADAHRRVVDAVLVLAEPYRSTVLYRYFEDLRPAEIAVRQDVPVGTVRTRLRRAIAQLRARLEADDGGDGRVWCLAPAPLLGLSRPTGTAGRAAAVTAAGVLLMGTKVKAAIALVALLLLVGAAWYSQAHEPPGSSGVRTVAGSADGASAAPRLARSSATEPPESASRTPGLGVVEVDVRSWDGRPVAGATAEVRRYEIADPDRVSDAPAPAAAGTSTTDERGLARIERLDVPFDYRLVVRAVGLGHASRVIRLASAAAPATVSVRLLGETHLRGRVLDGSGAPVQGAVVLARAGDGVAAGRAVTAAGGRFELSGLPYGLVSLYAGRKGMVLASSSFEARNAATALRLPFEGDVDLVLRPTARISGIVRDAVTGAPLAGAAVTLFARATFATSGPTRTDALGRYELSGPCNAIVDGAVVELAGYGAAPVSTGASPRFPFVVRDGDEMTLDLALSASPAGAASPGAGGAVEGRVLGPGGVPVGGARVGPVSAGPDGAFRIDAAPAGVEVIWDVAATGLAPAELIVTPPPAGETLHRDVHLATPPRLRGTVTTAGGAPAPQGTIVRVQVLVGRTGRPSHEPTRFLWTEFAVGADGSYDGEIPWAGPGRLRATASAPGRAPAIGDLIEIEAGGAGLRADLVFAEVEPIRGRVVDASNDAPVAGARILDGNIVVATSGPDGTFAFVGAGPGGTLRGAAVDARTCVRWQAGLQTVWSPGDLVEIRVEPARTISGIVTWVDGTPAVGAFVLAMPDGERTVSDAAGRFLVVGRQSRRQTILVEHPDAASAEAGSVEAGRTDLRIELRPGGVIAGRVLGADGAGVPGVALIACPEGRTGPVLRTSSGAGGEFVLPGAERGVAFTANLVPPDRPTADCPDSGRYRRTTARGLRAGEAPVDLRLDEGDSIAGSLVDEAGRPIAGAVLVAMTAPGGPEWKTTTDAAGRFRLVGLHAAEHRLTCVPGTGVAELRGGDSVPSGSQDVRLVGVPSVVLRGFVADEDGVAVRDARVIAPRPETVRRGPFPPADGRTGRDGSFEVRDLHPASGVVVIDAAGLVPEQVPATRAAESPQRITLRRGHLLTGRVTRADGSGVRASLLFVRRGTEWLSRTIPSDADGRFRSFGFADGVFDVIVCVGTAERVAAGAVEPSAGAEMTLRIP